VALTSTLHWFETEVPADERNYQRLARLKTDLVQHEATRRLTRSLILYIDSSESPVHGGQEQSAYNGYFEFVCYRPLFVFNQTGVGAALLRRLGNGDGLLVDVETNVESFARLGRGWPPSSELCQEHVAARASQG